jgi:hypothetical protein
MHQHTYSALPAVLGATPHSALRTPHSALRTPHSQKVAHG